METPFKYYSNPEKYGSYQYVSLKIIVDDFVEETLDDNSYIKNTRRYRIVSKSKSAIRELTLASFSRVKKIEITVPENLSIKMPHDFVKFIRCSVSVYDETTDSYRLRKINQNKNINIAKGYLQDNNAEILFDDDGFIVTADATNGYNKPYKKYSFIPGTADSTQISRNGDCIVDENRGTILFSSDLGDKEIVLEYLSDGLQGDVYGEDEIRIHKSLIPLLRSLVYYRLIEYSNIAQVEKNRALLRYKTILHQAKINRSKFNIFEISRAVRNSKRI